MKFLKYLIQTGHCSAVCQLLSHVWIFASWWTVAHQAPLSMGFPRQEYWSGLPFPAPGNLSDPGTELTSLHWQADSSPQSCLGSPDCTQIILIIYHFPCGSAGKETTCNEGDLGLIPELGRSPGEGNSYPLQYSDLENSMDSIVHGVTKSGQDWLSLHFSSLLDTVLSIKVI